MSIASTHEEIVALFERGNPAELKAFILACPEFPLQVQAAGLAGSTVPGAQALALGMVSQGLAFGRSVQLGAEIALAAHSLARRDHAAHGPEVILPVTLSRTAYEAIHALIAGGRYEEAVEFATEAAELYKDEPENSPSIRVGKITAFYELNRIDEAKKLLEEELKRGTTGPAAIELRRLEPLIRARTAVVTEKKKKSKTPVQPNRSLAKENERQRGIADLITSVLAGPGGEMNEWRVKKMIRDATSIFTDPVAGRDPARIRESVPTLETAENVARENGMTSDHNDALWGLYLCHSRLGSPSAAAAALQSLRENIEEARANIENPLERGGISSTYPFLYEALCRMLSQSGQTLELLDAMEGSKGRAVADLLAARAGQVVHERSLSRPATQLPELMRRNGAHYLSFFADDDESYGVLVAKDGSVHHSGSIPIGREALRAAARRVDPRSWDVPASDPLWSEARESTAEELAPLLSWLDPLAASGLLTEEDHICYSPDEHLHHIPLHYVQFRNEPLAARFSVSRSHGAYALALSLGRPAPPKPERYVGLVVPSKQNARDRALLADLQRPLKWLGEQLEGGTLQGRRTTPEKLARRSLRGRVVHLATHGVFPTEGAPRDENPYLSSGLLLACSDGLPDEEQVAKGRLTDAILTPARVRELEMDLSGSHVTLQACVTGLAEEGIGGDALGLDWALIQAGADSLLVSHWNVRASLSSEFFLRFYESWLVDGRTRAEAWRRTIQRLWAEGGDLADPYCWAAFSLSGDWR